MHITAPHFSMVSFILRYHCLLASLSTYIIFLSFDNFFVTALFEAFRNMSYSVDWPCKNVLFISSTFTVHLLETSMGSINSRLTHKHIGESFLILLWFCCQRSLLPVLLFLDTFFKFGDCPRSSVPCLAQSSTFDACCCTCTLQHMCH